jgi:acyl-CoA synthetase (NDP forming)
MPPQVLVVGDEGAARTVRDACADAGVLTARLTQQAERRLQVMVPSVMVDDNALTWTAVTSRDLRVTLDTVVDCPEVDVVIVALDQPHSRADRIRCRQLQDEASQVAGAAVISLCVSSAV